MLIKIFILFCLKKYHIIRVKFFKKKKQQRIYHKRNIHKIHLTVECGPYARLLEKVLVAPVKHEDILLM